MSKVKGSTAGAEENHARSMAILMRYEQVAGQRGDGLEKVGDEFGIHGNAAQRHIQRERIRATQGMKTTIRGSLPFDTLKRIYGG